MKISQIAAGVSYEDKRTEITRKVTAIITSGSERLVEYIEDSEKPLYWPLRKSEQMPIAEFAKWAARPAGAKSPFKNWKCGECERQFAKSR